MLQKIKFKELAKNSHFPNDLQDYSFNPYQNQQNINLLMRLINNSIRNNFSSSLKALLKDKLIPEHKENLTKLRKEHGNKVIGQIHVDDAVLGMRGLPVLFYDGSALDPMKGITFKGLSIPQFQKHAQKAKGGFQPLPEAMFWLLMTGRLPTETEFNQLQLEWRQKGVLTTEQTNFILSLPNTLHPMTMFSMSILFMQNKSKFFSQYQKGVNKSKYWQLYYDDSMDLLAKLPRVCAIIYRHKYRNSDIIEADNSLDWAANFAHMMGYNDFNMRECLRGYISIHADHEGGNVSAHTAHLVGSALADPYLSLSAALNGLAGPLHGLANQQCLKWLIELKEHHKGQRPNKSIIEEYVKKTLDSGRVVPGYGHAVLRNTDPRFVHLKEFADRNIKDDYICDLAKQCFETIPGVLGKVGKIKNPYPNVDAFSGSVLQHYGMVQYDFYTAVFGVSRALGCLSNGIWSRAFGLPIERPNSINMSFIEKL